MEADNKAICRILDKLAEVRHRGLTCFGSDHHHFQLNPPIDEETIRRFEHVHGIRLPSDYRAFLLLAGNGGAGPYYGLLPLEKWNGSGFEDRPGFLASPSPLRPDMPADQEREQALVGSRGDMFQGTLTVVDRGCLYYARMVVTGAYRGRVVYVNMDHPGSPYFVHHPDFLSWYERWLDELLWGYDDSWFGLGLPGREADLVPVLKEGGHPDLRNEALVTLGRPASLQPETLEVIQTLLFDGSARVRAQACSLLGQHGVAAASADIAARLGDDDPGVRKAALAALTKIPGADWEPDARRLLGDRDESAVRRALWLLRDAGRLRSADVEPLFQSPDASVRASALWTSDAIQGEPVEVPDGMLCDPDHQVRNYAFARWGRENPARVAVLCDLLRRETDADSISSLVRTLENIGDQEAVPTLLVMTEHADALVRLDAAQALGKLRDRRAIPALSALLSDHTKPYRRTKTGGGFSSNYTISQVARTALDQM